jgi:hypothetical protein
MQKIKTIDIFNINIGEITRNVAFFQNNSTNVALGVELIVPSICLKHSGIGVNGYERTALI